MKKQGVDLEREINALEQSRDEKIESLELELSEVKDKNELLQEELNSDAIAIGKVRNNKGALCWPGYVTKLILDLLANGTRPSAVSNSIAIHAKAFCREIVINGLPSESYIRRCRGILRCVEEMTSGYRLAKAKRHKQLHTDDASRRQVNMTSLIVRILEGDSYVPLTVLAHHIAKAHTAQGICLGTQDALDRAGIWVDRLKHHVEKNYQEYVHDMPSSEETHMGKFAGGFITLDACNTARKLGTELRDKIEEVIEETQMDPVIVNEKVMKTEIEPCQHHQRNICLECISKEISNV